MGGAALRPLSTWWVRGWMAVVVVVSIALAMATVQRNREYQSAITLARTVLDRYPHARAHGWLGEELIADGQREAGIAELRQATAGDPKAYYSLGMTMAEDGKADEAVEQLRQFVSKEPMLLEVVSARETMGRLLLRQGKSAEAEEQFRELVRMRPADANAHGLLADALFKEGKFEEAIPHYQQILKAKPNFVDVITNLGISSIAIGRVEEAIAYFRQAAEIDHSGATERNLARALLQKQAYQEAVLHAQSAVSLTPDDAVAHDELGAALAGLGRLDAAVLEFRRSLQLDPSDPEVREHLATVLRAGGGPGRRP
jgi:Flp pilus assembly protein TadD